MCDFVHLHCHTQFSLLDGATKISEMMDRAVEYGQKGVALTDHGNMFGAFKFVAEANRRNLKPIVGCEFYLVENRHKKKFLRSQGERDRRFHQLLLAKNEVGYKNLSKLCSLGFLEGMYNDFPRIDKELLLQHTEGLIATSCCIGAEIPQTILFQGEKEAEKQLKWWLDVFGDDYYIELQRHKGLEDIDGTGLSQEDVNQVLLRLAKKYNVKTIATNDSHYLNESDSKPHDILLCINTNNKLEDEDRFKFPSSDFYFKSTEEMSQLFSDTPESIANTMEIWDKVTNLDLKRDVLLPAFDIPKEFKSQEDYLRHITYLGAKRKYGEISPKIKERLDFELSVINQTGYPGYFLIVQDFTTAAREMGVWVGPGRGSAAGSAVAYALGITNVDPIKYDLLFERFLNPDRVSLPDIDIDFDDEGRSKVIEYVIDKYGHNQVAQIITYGSMAAKMSMRDVGRVMNIPLSEVDQVAKTFPSHLKASLNGILGDDGINPKLKTELNNEDLEKANKIRQLAGENTPVGQMLKTAKTLEGSVRNTGIHACGVIITPNDVRENVPVSKAKDSDIFVTQFDNNVVESAGLLKMDFLGLKTLTILKNAVEMIKERHDVDIVIEELPLDDSKAFEIFQDGNTTGIFQFESPGMRKNLKELKPSKFEDIIAMAALYRPGPMQYIPNYIARAHGKEVIEYDIPDMEEFLKETYGITVYQEQVMLLSQKLANFSKGQADLLRKAMGKKIKKMLDDLYPLFIEGCQKNGHAKEAAEKVWKDWEKFAQYAFNKSHSTCYAYIAYQSAYLKAHYPAEFMAAVLKNNSKDISKLNFFLKECKYNGLKVKGPSVNESQLNFSVNNEGEILVGLAGLKGVGEQAMIDLLEERKSNGRFTDLFDFIKRMNYGSFNKKGLEGLAYSGALDEFGQDRSVYFQPSEKYDTFLEHLLKFGNHFQQNEAQLSNSLFGDMSEEVINYPSVPNPVEWNQVQKLEKEKDIVGIYVTGHPLDAYRFELEALRDIELKDFDEVKKHGLHLKLGGLVISAQHGVNSKYNYGYARFIVQDFDGQQEFFVNKELYEKTKEFITAGTAVLLKGHYRENRWGDGPKMIRFYLDDIRLLSTVAENFLKKITVKVETEECNEKLIKELNDLCSLHKGEHRFNIVVRKDKHDIEFYSDKRVNIGSDFVDHLSRLGLAFKLN